MHHMFEFMKKELKNNYKHKKIPKSRNLEIAITKVVKLASTMNLEWKYEIPIS